MQTRTRHRTKPAPPTTDVAEAPAPGEHVTAEDASDWLDEIDAVLEENAQDFIDGFVQKGGE